MKHRLEERRLMIDRSENGLSISQQCRLLSLHRSGLYYRPCGESEENLRLMKFIESFSWNLLLPERARCFATLNVLTE